MLLNKFKVKGHENEFRNQVEDISNGSHSKKLPETERELTDVLFLKNVLPSFVDKKWYYDVVVSIFSPTIRIQP